jgi:hypothetical protein
MPHWRARARRSAKPWEGLGAFSPTARFAPGAAGSRLGGGGSFWGGAAGPLELGDAVTGCEVTPAFGLHFF